MQTNETPPFPKIVTINTGLSSPRFCKERIIIGSLSSADVCLKGPSVAPIHAIIEVNASPLPGAAEAMIYDLASESGIFVNGKKIVTSALKTGDRFEIGGHELTVAIGDGSQTVPAKTSDKKGPSKPELVTRFDAKARDGLLLIDEEQAETIFDFPRADAVPALEVVLAWHGSILDVRHFVGKQEVRVGEARENDFVIPRFYRHENYGLVKKYAGEYCLNVEAPIEGVIHVDGQTHDLRKLRDELKGKDLRLKQHSVAKLREGNLEFFLSFTPPPPRLKQRRIIEKDPLFLKIQATSAVLSAFLLFGLLQVSLPETIEPEKLPERVATVLFQPEKFSYPYRKQLEAEARERQAENERRHELALKKESKPSVGNSGKGVISKLPQAQTGGSRAGLKSERAQNEGKEGAGARAKGAEGQRGKPNAPKSATAQYKVKGGGASQVENIGNIDALKGASQKIVNLLGGSAQVFGKKGQRLKGFGAFDTEGSGGQALSGSGPGGGGTSVTAAGLSDHGRGGGKVGTGLGAVGRGSNIIGGQVRVALNRAGPEESVVMGAIDQDAIAAAIFAHRDEFLLCYEREINQGAPQIAGRVNTSFVIGSSGRVTQAGVISSSLNNRNTESCVLKVIRRIDFPAPLGGGIVQVRFPFKFRPVGG